MFFRIKTSGPRRYVQLVENFRVQGKIQQRVLATLGRLELLQNSGDFDSLMRSGMRLAQKLAILDAHEKGETTSVSEQTIGLPMVFGRLWKELGIAEVIDTLIADRKYRFSVERAVFLTVLHRLSVSGSDRAADIWKERCRIEGAEKLELQHLYRAMAWLGEELPGDEQQGATPFTPRCVKDRIEELIFDRKRNLFEDLRLVFFDTTSIHFEGQGGETIGRKGHSKSHRSDLMQMVVGVIMDSGGRPVCCEMWPGNTTDVRTLLPIVGRLRKRFGIQRICVVADRGMISKDTIREMEGEEILYILGVRFRSQKEVKEEVLSRAGRYQEVHPNHGKAPSPLKVKQVKQGDKRYIVCVNEDQAKKDAHDRDAIVAALREQLKKGQKSLVGNKGYKTYLKATGSAFEIDEDKIKEEARYDGKWVLITNMDIPSQDVALQYKELWQVEDIFRKMKSVLMTRPIYHKCDETIRGHVFCSFLSLLLIRELEDRMQKRGCSAEWARLIDDLEAVRDILILTGNKEVHLRTDLRGDAGRAFQAAGVSIPPTVKITERLESNHAG